MKEIIKIQEGKLLNWGNVKQKKKNEETTRIVEFINLLVLKKCVCVFMYLPTHEYNWKKKNGYLEKYNLSKPFSVPSIANERTAVCVHDE